MSKLKSSEAFGRDARQVDKRENYYWFVSFQEIYLHTGHWIGMRNHWVFCIEPNSPRASHVLSNKSHEIALSNLYIEFIVQRIVFNLFKLRMHSPSCTRKSILRKLINLCKSNTHKNRFWCSFPTSFYTFWNERVAKLAHTPPIYVLRVCVRRDRNHSSGIDSHEC